MSPTIKHNNFVLVSGLMYLFKNPAVNDIVAFKHTNSILIKRITKILENKYFVKGDNPKDSLDSKQIGLISKKQILGKVIYIL